MAHLHSFQPTEKQVGENLDCDTMCLSEMRETEGREGRFEERFHGDRHAPLLSFLELVGSFMPSARYNIISYTQEKNFGMIENSLDLTERRGRPRLEMRKYFFKKVNDLKASLRKPNCTPGALSSNLNRKGSNALHALYWCWGWTGCSNGKRCKWKRFWTVKINACFYWLNNLKVKRNIKIKLPTPFPSP